VFCLAVEVTADTERPAFKLSHYSKASSL